MVVHNITSKAEFDKAIKDNKVVILDCSAEWCGPCKMIAPKFHEFSEKQKSIYFATFDVDQVPDLAQELGVRAMPTFKVFKNGEKEDDLVGANPKALEDIITKHNV